MAKTSMTIREAAEEWVGRDMNEIDLEMIATLMEYEPDDWTNVTPPQNGDRVYVFDTKKRGNGEITEISFDDLGEKQYGIELEDGQKIKAYPDEFEVERGSGLPIWGTLWSFRDLCDADWLENNLDTMAECGFTIIHSDKFGYFFGIDGAGYNFYDSHWIPLYKARGLHWHEED